MSDWQPIETAPKDGTRVLVCYGSKPRVIVAYWQSEPSLWEREDVPCWAVFEPEDPFYSVYLLDEYEPTHWQPLPKPPLSPSAPNLQSL
ncbi:MAG TPA: DUF551 domain-containing protein [Edaphobacter sp.]|nr:DUF551 domain-containing protein [Edaphobacter sp.]